MDAYVIIERDGKARNIAVRFPSYMDAHNAADAGHPAVDYEAVGSNYTGIFVVMGDDEEVDDCFITEHNDPIYR